MSSSLAKLLYKVFKVYGVSITRHTIEQIILTHPDYPSIRCVSDALDCWKVKHLVLKLPLEKLHTLNVSVIVPLEKGEYVWITHITESEVHYWNGSGKEKVESCDRFKKEWSGVALAIEDVDDAEESNYKEDRRNELKERLFKSLIAGTCAALLIILLYFSWINDSCLPLLPKLLLLLVNAAGCYIGYTLIRQEKHQPNRLVQKFCKAGTNIDCQQVTASPYSKLFGVVSWAELGMAYFSAVILWLAIAPVNVGWLLPLWWLLLAPLPFTIWSLFTQTILIRKWCLFCCAIVFLLWINAGILYLFLPFNSILPVVESSLLALLLLACTIAVQYITNKNGSHDPYSEQRETARIKYDFKTMQSQLSEFYYKIDSSSFAWRNSQAAHEITLYVSIACSHCGKAVKELKRITDIYPDFNYRLIFAVYSDNYDDESNVIIGHLITLYTAMNKDEFFKMLDAWYTMPDKNLEALQTTYPISNIQDSKDELDALYQFSQQNNIDYTPAILIHGR